MSNEGTFGAVLMGIGCALLFIGASVGIMDLGMQLASKYGWRLPFWAALLGGGLELVVLGWAHNRWGRR